MQPIIGINLPACQSLEQLSHKLETFKNNGFDAVEINLESFPLIIEGEICTKWVTVLKKELEKHPLLYSAHIGRGLDLRNTKDHKLHMKVLRSSIKICRELKCDLLVLHYEVMSQDHRAEKQFFEAHKTAAEYAGELGIKLCVENIEVENVEPVIELVDKLNLDNVKMTFDTGHAFLASKYFNFDFIEAVKKMAPYLGHVHLSDNTGRFEELRITNRSVYDVMPMGWRREFGRGDIHLPPYYGKIPYDDIFRLLKNYRGKYICEYTSESFLPFNREIQENVRKKIIAMGVKAGSKTQ